MRRTLRSLPLFLFAFVSGACGRAVLNVPDVNRICDGEVCTYPDVSTRDGDATLPDGEGNDVPFTDRADTGTPDTRVPRCGDSVLDPGEQCDDDNNTNGDGC